MDVYKEELRNRNPGSVVDIAFDIDGDKKRFQRFFVSLVACSVGFLAGCRPYISLDACHLKGKFNGVLAAATCVDGNNSLFPLAYSVLESENAESWTWFLENLRKAIGTSDGLVISLDMQKGLAIAIMQTYPNSEHKECIRHLYSNFKKKFRGDFFTFKLWGATKTYCVSEHDRLLKEIADVCKEAITYLHVNHNKNLGEYEVCRSSENQAEVKFKGKRWVVILDDTQCTCHVWQVTGLICVHAAAFIAFIRDANWEKYVDPYYTIKKFKEAYALEIAPLPDKDEWMDIQPGEKIYPPIIKRPAGRPRKNRTIAADEHTKRRHNCSKCGGIGHRPKTCKNAQSEENEANKSSAVMGETEVYLVVAVS
ncbi:hypothetical protein Tco_0983173 [Tanacetum coccineum]